MPRKKKYPPQSLFMYGVYDNTAMHIEIVDIDSKAFLKTTNLTNGMPGTFQELNIEEMKRLQNVVDRWLRENQ